MELLSPQVLSRLKARFGDADEVRLPGSSEISVLPGVIAAAATTVAATKCKSIVGCAEASPAAAEGPSARQSTQSNAVTSTDGNTSSSTMPAALSDSRLAPSNGYNLLTDDELAKHAALIEAVRDEVGPSWIEPRVALTILFTSKLCVEDASKSYRKWVKMLSAFGFEGVSELLGPTVSAMPSSDDEWMNAADWAELRADIDSHGFIHAAGTDNDGRQVMWEHGVMSCAKGREKAVMRVITLVWLAVHADLMTLREGVTVVHTVAADDGKLLMQKSTRSLIAATAVPNPSSK